MGGNVNSVWAEHKELKQHIIKIENAAAKTSLFTQEKGIYQPVLENAQHYIDMNRAVQVLGAERLQKYHIRNSQEEMDDLVREHASRSGYVAKLDEKEKKRVSVRRTPRHDWVRGIHIFRRNRRNCWRRETALRQMSRQTGWICCGSLLLEMSLRWIRKTAARFCPWRHFCAKEQNLRNASKIVIR